MTRILPRRESDLWFADDGYRPERIAATPRSWDHKSGRRSRCDL